jgi:hypothetical protein
MHEPLDLIARLAAGECDAEVMRWLVPGASAWVRARGAVCMEQCLRLPTTAARLRRAERDYWLMQAARGIEAAGPYSGAMALKAEIDKFLARGPWFAWRDLAEPPAGASKLRSAIFHAVKLNNGDGLSRRALQDIVGSAFRKKLPTSAPTLDASHQ